MHHRRQNIGQDSNAENTNFIYLLNCQVLAVDPLENMCGFFQICMNNAIRDALSTVIFYNCPWQ